MITIFISAFLLGLIFNAAPGAVFAESLRRGLQHGYYSALHVQFGSLVGDATWAILGLLGAGLLFQIPAVRIPLSVLGALYLIYLGLQTLREVMQSHDSHVQSLEVDSVSEPQKGALLAGVSMSLTNPANVIYWGALGSVFGSFGIRNPSKADYGVFFAGFMSSSILWCFICAGLIHMMHRAMSPRIAVALNTLCGVCLLFLGSKSMYDLIAQ